MSVKRFCHKKHCRAHQLINMVFITGSGLIDKKSVLASFCKRTKSPSFVTSISTFTWSLDDTPVRNYVSQTAVSYLSSTATGYTNKPIKDGKALPNSNSGLFCFVLFVFFASIFLLNCFIETCSLLFLNRYNEFGTV